MNVAGWLIIGAGIALRLVAWSQRSSLWLDEAAIALNIENRSLWNLLSIPLDYGQAAPKGFLLLQWSVTHVLGTSALAYRVLPLIAGVVALFLFRQIANRVLSGTGALVALGFFAVGFWFIYFSADAKPYAFDLCLSLLVLALTLDFHYAAYAPARGWRLAATGALATWLSNGTVITLAGLAIGLLVVVFAERGARATLRTLWPVFCAWAAGSVTVLWVELRSQFPGQIAFLHRSNAYLFPPPALGLRGAAWFWREWRSELSMWHGWRLDDARWTSLFPALALIGLLGIARRWRIESVFVAAPIAVFMAAAIAQQYPYGARFTLFPLALLMLGIGESADRLSRLARSRAIGTGASALLCVPPLVFVAANPPPYPWSAVGSYLTAIKSRWQAGDVLYVSYGRALEVMYHAPRLGFDPRGVTLGVCDFSDTRVPLRATDALRGRRRVWAIVDPGDRFPSVDFAYLRTIGVLRDSLAVEPTGTRRLLAKQPYDIETAYLLDLSDTVRLARTSAEAYRPSPWMARRTNPARAWACHGVFSPLVRESDRVSRAMR